MPPFKFRIRFFLPEDYRLKHPAARLEVELGGPVGSVTLVGLAKEGTISDSGELVIRSAGFSTEEDATRAGQALANGLLLSAVRWRLGMDLGEDASKSHL